MDTDQQDQHYVEQLRSSAIPIAKFRDGDRCRPDMRRVIKDAPVVIGYDTGRPLGPSSFTIFSGLRRVERVAKAEDRQATTEALVIAYDQRTDDLEWLSAACQVLRGSCDYQPSEDATVAVKKASGVGNGGSTLSVIQKIRQAMGVADDAVEVEKPRRWLLG